MTNTLNTLSLSSLALITTLTTGHSLAAPLDLAVYYPGGLLFTGEWRKRGHSDRCPIQRGGW